MQWSDVVKAPSTKTLRQFAVLSLVVFGGLAAWRFWHGQTGLWTDVLAGLAVVIGLTGIVAPPAIRPIYSGWMIAAFPIGWTVSKITLGGVFYLVFTPVGLVFRLMGRDLLALKRPSKASYWVSKTTARTGEDYLRQF